MATVTRIGPADHGRPMTFDEYLAGDYEPGYKYELIDGELYVSPEANFAENRLEMWLLLKLGNYWEARPDVLRYLTNKARVFVPERRDVTAAEPDLAAYRTIPPYKSARDVNWQEFHPILVGEVLYQGDAYKDVERNVDLYLQVPSIKEYWLVDARQDPDRPTLRIHRRHGKQWRISEVAPGETYSTRLLPGFELVNSPPH
jgi:Uma2 family endonuclease